MNNNLASPERAKQACRQPRKLLSSNPCEVGCVIVPPRQQRARQQPPDFLSMLTVADALAAVLAEARPLHPQTCLLHEAQGSVLAEDVRADADSPPFDKALVDGYAVRTADLQRSVVRALRRRAHHGRPNPDPPSRRGRSGRDHDRCPAAEWLRRRRHARADPCDRSSRCHRTDTSPARPEHPAARRRDASGRGRPGARQRAPSRRSSASSRRSVEPRCKPYRGPASQSYPPETSWSSPVKAQDRARSATRMPSCCAPWPSEAGAVARTPADRARRTRRAGPDPAPGPRGRPRADHRRSLRRPARPRSGGARVAGGAQGLPQDQSQAGQAALVRRRIRATRRAPLPSSSDCPATR